MAAILRIEDLRKTYEGGFEALRGVTLEVEKGEILALLGPNGAGKTTLISTVCGLTVPTGGSVRVDGHDILRDFRAARRLIGLVPQEIALEPFQKVWEAVRFSRGVFGLPRDDAHLESVLRQLSLWDKRDAQTRELSGGMKRRVMIAKALAHEPRVLFLDEPTAGVDVELRRGMWETVVGVINRGELLLVEKTGALMDRMGRKELVIELREPLPEVPAALAGYDLELARDGAALVYSYDRRAERTGITRLLADLQAAGLVLRDLSTRQSSLEEIFVGLVQEDAA
ncbi:MAG: ABC transporter ATP-binding protein [Rhodosalinus sp.]